jgi:NTP pyrophosphatase (non-canonical NTP hydrolase)
MNIENLTYEISKLKYECTKYSVTELCKQAFETAKSKGWHDNARTFSEAVALIHAEASEALEADRRNEGKERVAEELADICIRVFDCSMEFGVDLETAILTKMEYNKSRSFKHGNKKY